MKVICIYLSIYNISEAKFQLKQAIAQARETLTDSEKLSGKWNKEDKVYKMLMDSR